MSIFKNVFKPTLRADSVQDLTVKQVNSGLFGLPLIFNTSQTVATETTALTLSAFYNAIDILSDDIAKLPKHVYKRAGDSRKKADHKVQRLIGTRPHPKMNAYTFWKTIETLRLLRGNAYAEIVRNPGTGEALYFAIRDNDKVEVFETDTKLFYKYNKQRVIDQEDMLHFVGFTLDGKCGVGIVTYAAAQLGVSLENQKYGETIYKNRGLTYGVIESDNEVQDANKKLLADGFNAKLSTQDPHKVAVLDEGMKYKQIAISPQEAQFLETYKNGVKEVCRWLNIAPHLLKDLDSANYSNIYQQSIEHVQLSVLPRVISKEQELDYKLFTEAEQGTYYVKFNINALLRGDLQSKAQYYTAMVYSGIYTRNEIRELEDINPIAGLEEPLQPVNMQALSIAMELQKTQNNGANNK